jgi:outer membrane immunogenic protein
MKSVLVSGVGALAFFAGIAAAQAADMPARTAMPAKAPAYVAPVFTWTGPYIGINGGWGFGNSEYTGGAFRGSPDIDGGMIGATIGYNWQMGQAVFGLEGDIDWSDIRGGAACGGGTNCNTKNQWLGTARGRLGYAFGQFMPYVTGGLAVGDFRTAVSGVGSTSQTNAGWTLGAGVEASLWGPVSAKLEYLYVDLGNGDVIPGTAGTRGDFRTNIVRAGLNYHF